uniref:Ribonuclease H-like domain-containing protein n=1 Tax=Tanacetum cinerariifolium TaxID=118510 RepID=A0A6L2MRW1_TANCI|nr:ribonuclease H-like domain-containing protein [Tanacetum cinerariifolium]
MVYYFSHLCHGYGILDHLVDLVASSSTATPTAPPHKDVEWTKIDFIIRSWIFWTLAPSLRKHLVYLNPTTAKDAWTYIAGIFQDNKRPRAMALKVELRNLKLGDLSIDGSFQKIESIVSVLNCLGSPLSNDNFVTFALEGLPSTYETISTVIVSQEPFPDLRTGSCRFGDACKYHHNGVHGKSTLLPRTPGLTSSVPDVTRSDLDMLGSIIHNRGFRRFFVYRRGFTLYLDLHSRQFSLRQGFNSSKGVLSLVQFTWDSHLVCLFIRVSCLHLVHKDFITRRVLLHCDSTGDLYPVTKPSTTPHDFLTNQYTWHQRLGHPGNTNHKLGPRATPSIFLEHAANHFGYRCLDLNTNKIIISHHVTFDEMVFPFPSTKSTTTHSYDFFDDSTDLISTIIRIAPITPVPALVHTSQVDVPTPPTPPPPPIPPPPPTPQSVPQIVPKHAPAPTNDSPTVSNHPIVTRSRIGTTRPNPRYAGHVSTISPLPYSYKEVFNDPNWRNAMFDNRYKARPVANGSTQVEGVDVDETFSPVVKPLQQIIASSHCEFSMTDLGTLNYFLGISVTRDSSSMFLSQRKYAMESLKRAHIVGCNPSRTPVDTESKLGDGSTPVVDPTLYRSLKGSLQYLTFTRPDITYVGTLDYGLQLLSSTTDSLIAYSDADWAGCPTTRRSTLGAEAKYHGVANAVAKTCWIWNLLHELHTPLSSAIIVYCDNVSAVYLSSNPVQHQRTKHIEIDIHFVQDLVATRQVHVLHVPSRFQYADIFTKGLPLALFDEFCDSLSVRCTPAPTAKEY